jgi:shikimate dehydrogenase
MQNRAFKEAGLNTWLYVPMPVAKYPYIRIKEAIFGLRALGFHGANITVPYKESVLSYLEQSSDEAKAIGAVNTILVDHEGRLVGHNTDGMGFIKDLLDHGVNPIDFKVLILGAGGSARAITYALLCHGCKNILILNRTKTKADDIANAFHLLFKDANIETDSLAPETLRRAPHADLIVNATSIGLEENGQMPWDKNIHLSKSQIVYDIIYNPKMTTFLEHAAQDGAKVMSGLGMLVHQGALAFELWTGQKAPLSAMKDAAIKALS